MGYEYTREFRVTIYRDTNKNTYEEKHENAVDAVLALLPMLSEDEFAQVAQAMEDM